MGHVDALSHHVGSVAHENTLDREILREQEKDAFCKNNHQDLITAEKNSS